MTIIVNPMAEQLPPWLEGIEGAAAQQLIDSDAQVIRVVAGPGSGKTTCLKRRIQRLIQQDQINSKTIFVGTFTRTIAGELKEALGADIEVSTLHSLAYKLLRKYPVACQGMKLRFLLKFEEDALLYDVENSAVSVGDIYKRRKALRLLQASRAQRTYYSNASLDGEIRRWLQKHRAMLIGEVVHLCATGLESEDIPSGMFQHVVIDEYQDLTAVEQELVHLIWSKAGTLTVMGDDDQSIYGFRFNHPKGISDFDKTWPQCKDITFTDNRRCAQSILNTANLMMAEAGSKKPPMTWKSNRIGNLKAVHWETLDEEISGIAEYVHKREKESFLILVPRRFIGYRLADAIGSSAKTAFSEEVLEHPIAQNSFTIASLLANPEDFVAARAYLGFRADKYEHASRRNATAYASIPSDIGGHELIKQIAQGVIKISGDGQNHIRKQAERAMHLINQSLSSTAIIDLVFNNILAKEENDDEKRYWLIDDLLELRDAAQKLLAREPTPSLSEVMSILRYRIATRTPLRTPDDQGSRVKIMTLHSAKGLEAENVIIAGVANQFLPGKDNDSQIIAEQKRLLYVAVTRARDNLIISWPRLVRTSDLMKDMGQLDRVIIQKGVKWGITSRSSLLPQGLGGITNGKQLLI